MDRTFLVIVVLDVAALALPTRGLGSKVEFWLALALIAATTAVWLRLRLRDEGN